MPQTITQPVITVDKSINATVISQKQLIDMLSETKGATIITIVAKTEPKMKKTGNPYYDKVRKISRVNGIVNFHYDEGVKRRLEKEGKNISDFRQGESWHEPVIMNDKLTPFCRHKKNGNMYLRFMELKRIGTQYQDIAGNVIDENKIKPFLYERTSYENQGLDTPLKFLVYGLDSIMYIMIDGNTYLVK